MNFGHYIFAVSMVVFLGQSCRTDDEKEIHEEQKKDCYLRIEYNSDSLVVAKGEFCEDLKEGRHYWYHDDGSIETIADFCKDTLCGVLIELKKNGDTLGIEDHTQNTSSKMDIYWDYEKGIKKKRENFRLYSSDNWHKNQWWTYDLDGNLLLDHSRFYEVVGNPRQFNCNSIDTIEIKLTAP